MYHHILTAKLAWYLKKLYNPDLLLFWLSTKAHLIQVHTNIIWVYSVFTSISCKGSQHLKLSETFNAAECNGNACQKHWIHKILRAKATFIKKHTVSSHTNVAIKAVAHRVKTQGSVLSSDWKIQVHSAYLPGARVPTPSG